MEQSRPVLLVVPSLREAWDDVIAPWFDQVLPETWKRALPSLIVVPTRGQANDLKARLIAKGSSHLGLHFVTPASLGALLARDDATLRAKPIDGVCNKRCGANENFRTCSSSDSTERIGHSGFSCALLSSWQNARQSCLKSRAATFPMSIFAGSAHGRKSVAKRSARRNPFRRLAIRFLAKRKCAVARKRQNISIFSSARISPNNRKQSRSNAFVI